MHVSKDDLEDSGFNPISGTIFEWIWKILLELRRRFARLEARLVPLGDIMQAAAGSAAVAVALYRDR